MEFSYIQGFHGGMLLYLHEEKHLFVKSHDRNGQVEFICYEETLSKEKYKNDEVATQGQQKKTKCTAKSFVRDNHCRRNKIQHQVHPDHELVYQDLQTLNAVKEKCKLLAEWCPLSSHKISSKEIFLVELSK